MRLPNSTAALAASVAAFFLPPTSTARGQQETIVSNDVEISSRAASLHLEFSSGEHLEIAFSDGVAVANGYSLGNYEPGGAADRAWRDLLAAAMPLGNGPLARVLERWQPDGTLSGSEGELLGEVDRVLERAVATTNAAGAPSRGPAWNQNRLGGEEERARALLHFMSRHGQVRALGLALEGVDFESLELVLGEDRAIPPDASVASSIFAADGTIEVQGRIRGHAIVVDGVIVLEEGGRVDGDVRLVDAELERRGGSLQGNVVDVLREIDGERTARAPHPRDDVVSEATQHRWDGRRPSGVISRVGRAAGGVLEAGVSFMILAFLTLLAMRLAGDRVDAVAQAVEHNPARSAAVGLAGSFLALPLYLLGAVVLAVTIVGIPVLLAWVPLFPVVAAAAAAVGYLATSHHVGRWIANQDIPWLDRVDRHNPTHLKLVGIGALTAPFAVAAVVRAVPVAGWIGGIVQALGTLACVAAVIIGLGAVIITRGGRYPASDYDFAETLDSEQWSSAVEEDES